MMVTVTSTMPAIHMIVTQFLSAYGTIQIKYLNTKRICRIIKHKIITKQADERRERDVEGSRKMQEMENNEK